MILADGCAGRAVRRGNRSSGLITPFRPMTPGAVAGKNPVTRIGKLTKAVAGAEQLEPG